MVYIQFSILVKYLTSYPCTYVSCVHKLNTICTPVCTVQQYAHIIILYINIAYTCMHTFSTKSDLSNKGVLQTYILVVHHTLASWPVHVYACMWIDTCGNAAIIYSCISTYGNSREENHQGELWYDLGACLKLCLYKHVKILCHISFTTKFVNLISQKLLCICIAISI